MPTSSTHSIARTASRLAGKAAKRRRGDTRPSGGASTRASSSGRGPWSHRDTTKGGW